MRSRRLNIRQRLVLAAFGVPGLITGIVALFTSTNWAGTATLILAAATMLAIGVLGNALVIRPIRLPRLWPRRAEARSDSRTRRG